MRLTEQSFIERKEKIIHTAYELFCEYGVDGVTLAQIAKEAKVGASAIYRYFNTKTNLLWYTQKILWQEIVGKFDVNGQQHILSTKNGYEELSVLMYRFKALYEQHSDYILFANEYKMYLVRNNIKLPEQDYCQLMKAVSDTFQNALRRGQADGSISSEESVENQYFVVWGLMRGYVEQMVTHDHIYHDGSKWENRFEQAYHYVLKSVKNEK